MHPYEISNFISRTFVSHNSMFKATLTLKLFEQSHLLVLVSLCYSISGMLRPVSSWPFAGFPPMTVLLHLLLRLLPTALNDVCRTLCRFPQQPSSISTSLRLCWYKLACVEPLFLGEAGDVVGTSASEPFC